MNKNGSTLYTELNNTGIDPNASGVAFTGFKGQVGFVSDLADDDGADWIGFEPAGSGAVARSAQDKLRETVSVLDFGADNTGATDAGPAINAALLAAANAGGKSVYIPAGRYRINTTVNIGPGVRVFGDGTTDALNSLSPRLGTELLAGTATPMVRMVGASDISGWPAASGGGDQGYGFKGITLYSQNATSATGLQIGVTGGSDARNVYIEDFNSRGFLIGIDVQRSYELSIKRFSIRNIIRPAGSIAIKLDGEITSGSITDGAIYEYETGVLVDNVMAGAEVANIDFDACDVCAKTNGFIYNSSLFRNLASEGTVTSDFIFNHTGNAGLIGFATIVGTSSDHRIRSTGSGITYIRNTNLNSALFASGKRGISVEGSGDVVVDDSIGTASFNWNIVGTGIGRTPTVSIVDNLGAGYIGQKQYSFTLGSTDDTRTIVIELLGSGLTEIDTWALAGGSDAISSWKLNTHVVSGVRYTGTRQILNNGFATLTQVDVNTIELSWSNTFNGTAVRLSVGSGHRARRKA
jgi:hypothetical protein